MISFKDGLKISLVSILIASAVSGVTSQIKRHKEAPDFAKGKTKNVVVTSQGNIHLGRETEKIAEEFEDVWSINAIVKDGANIYFGTSPNGSIYKHSLGELEKIYPENDTSNEPNTADPNDPNVIEEKQRLTNEHIFAMTKDISGRILAAISGKECRVIKFEDKDYEIFFEPADANYIFDMIVADDGSIFLATGPEGKIYQLNPMGKSPKVVLDSEDKNILSLAYENGMLYAGTDTRGVVYKVDTMSGKTRVLYDSDQEEIVSLTVEGDFVYAAGTTANVVQVQERYAEQTQPAGRPDTQQKEEGNGNGGTSVKIAHTQQQQPQQQARRKPSPGKGAPVGKTSVIYKISDEGFVTEVFREPAVFFEMTKKEDKLALGTGNKGQLFEILPEKELSSVIYEDDISAQVTAVVSAGDRYIIGTANPAKLITVRENYAKTGTFKSELVDASQPAKWGNIQIDAQIPENCEVMVSTRTGNIQDVNDPAFSDWTQQKSIKGPVAIDSPVGRFLQYSLTLKSQLREETPFVREVAVASTIPNIAPQVKEVKIEPAKNQNKPLGLLKISYSAQDDNQDTLVYDIELRMKGREKWITIAEDNDKPEYEWDSRTVEDGRYEIRVTAKDILSNTPDQAMTGSRISDPLVVDNTAPDFVDISYKVKDDDLVTGLTLVDELSAIGKLHYTVNSSDKWKLVVPEDMVFDTTSEKFRFTVTDLQEGKHVISLKAEDNLGNAAYKSFVIEVD